MIACFPDRRQGGTPRKGRLRGAPPAAFWRAAPQASGPTRPCFPQRTAGKDAAKELHALTRGFEFQIANDFSAGGIAIESLDADPDARDARLKEPGGRQAGA